MQLTKDVAEQFLKAPLVDLFKYTAVDDTAAKSLAAQNGDLFLNLSGLPKSAAEILHAHAGNHRRSGTES